ncbi:DUF2267 domain-containing protein [Nonomuraea rubra]|uniref:Putative pterin-4-alpha-carbinolamine dehydratase n=1 Tax=Nonomuraea rubra TaxID=46180 RepID=A0A7X0P875_9ACTN|nr:DUF2267 domain-containing protein [Nonomuraea rubra]MBB6557065.1 pterin-4a-carbinolamine dehydratase/uncharacterized protein (DUF2267 family) [Nonomuraea rubra]
MVEYRELLRAIGRMTGLAAGPARAAAEATLTTLARTLDEADRRELIDALPPELTDDFPMDRPGNDGTEEGFVRQAALLGRRPPEQARIRAQAVLAAVAEQDPALVARLHIPEQVRGLFEPPGSGGGITGPKGHSAPLTDAEIDSALRTLPRWSGDRSGLRRTISLPQENLHAVRRALDRLKITYGRQPQLHDTADGLVLLVRTVSVGAVTSLDVELARRVDELIEEIGAGIGRP